MDDAIVSRDYWCTKGRDAFEAGRGRDDHDMNPGAAAIKEFQDGWDRAYAAWAHPEEAAA
jgi:hypothetical protein